MPGDSKFMGLACLIIGALIIFPASKLGGVLLLVIVLLIVVGLSSSGGKGD